MPERLAQAVKLPNARTDSNRFDRLDFADDFKIFMHLVRSYLRILFFRRSQVAQQFGEF